MIVPSIAACFLYTPYWEVAFVAGFDYLPYRSASQTFRLLFGDSWQYLWPVIVVAVMQVIAAALVMSATDKHFRTGKLSLRSPWRLINNSVYPIAVGVVIMSVASVILRFLLFGLVSLVQATASAMSLSSGAALATISVVAVAIFVFHVLLITPMLYWAPIMFIYGYKFRDAAALSFKLISGKRLFAGLLLPMLICAGLQLLIGFLQAHIAVRCAVGFFVFLFTNVYVTTYTMVTFYSVSDLDRRDIKPYQNPILPRVRDVKAEERRPIDVSSVEAVDDNSTEQIRPSKKNGGAKKSESAKKRGSAQKKEKNDVV